jgi:hypothetical protein
MTCINGGKEPWADKVNPLGPESCDPGPGSPPKSCPEGQPSPGPFGPGCPGWEVGPNECPAAPLNVEVVSPLFSGTLDLRWDNPAIQAKNSKFDVVGVNIYRSMSSERGPYHRLNVMPVGGTFYRDFTDNVLVQDEVVDWDLGWIHRGNSANSANWKFRTKNYPIVKRGNQAISANSPSDVQVIINNKIIPVHEVFGPTGEITLINVPAYDYVRERWLPPTLPTGPETQVTVTYSYNSNAVRTDLDKKIWYRLTTIALDAQSPTGFRETPLEFSEPVTHRNVERVDWIWREAMRRNNFILEQGGERVKVFIKKTSGEKCFCCRDARTLDYSKQPNSRCELCFGTGFVGGYEGPYDMIISPDDNERAVRQTPTGRHLEHVQDVFTNVSPMLTQRDFIVKQSNERYSIGPVRKPSVRGVALQQHFQIRYLDEKDIRYTVPLFETTDLCWPECRVRPAPQHGGGWATEQSPQSPYPVGVDPQQTPMQTEKDNIPDEREQRGRTPVWSNLTY